MARGSQNTASALALARQEQRIHARELGLRTRQKLEHVKSRAKHEVERVSKRAAEVYAKTGENLVIQSALEFAGMFAQQSAAIKSETLNKYAGLISVGGELVAIYEASKTKSPAALSTYQMIASGARGFGAETRLGLAKDLAKKLLG